MSDTTAISWTDHTFNPWWGCTAIAPGCDNCYAAAFDRRTGGDHWDPKTKPRLTKPANWRKPLRWNRQAGEQGRRARVFCGSMMDWCDKDAPPGALDALWQIIRETPWLDWQLLTKRATLIRECLPADWGDGYPNVWLGVTVENMQHGYPRINVLRRIPARVRFLSCEPLLGRLNGFDLKLRGIDWVIVGGESGPGCRPMDIRWPVELFADCRQHGVPFFFKQWGGTGKDKGGDQLAGGPVKEWPIRALPMDKVCA